MKESDGHDTFSFCAGNGQTERIMALKLSFIAPLCQAKPDNCVVLPNNCVALDYNNVCTSLKNSAYPQGKRIKIAPDGAESL